MFNLFKPRRNLWANSTDGIYTLVVDTNEVAYITVPDLASPTFQVGLKSGKTLSLSAESPAGRDKTIRFFLDHA